MRTAIATKFVAWEVPSLENLQGSKVYGLRTKLNNGEKLSREEKDWLTRNVNSNTYFKSAVPLQGWMFDFSDILYGFSQSPESATDEMIPDFDGTGV